MKKCIILITAVCLFSNAFPQINGYVFSDDTGEHLAGASLGLARSGLSGVTDEHGAFTFSGVTFPDTLVVRYVGYTIKAIPVLGPNTDMVIYLQSQNHAIAEVMVNTGYQSVPKERATGSFTHIDSDLFNRSVSTDLISRLEGVTNGLSYELPRTREAPSATPNLRVRGLSTIHGETEPLIVVDNFPYEGDIGNINPNDVESITVLKDAAAASIWGARAGNGVIVITTKRGAMSRKPTVNVNSNVSITEKPDLHYSRTFLPPADMVELERTLFGRGLYTKNDWTAYTPAIDILFALDEGLLDEAQANARLEDLKRYDIRDEAARHLYRQSVNQQYAMNVNGGGENYHYYVSAGFDNNAGSLVGNGYERITFNAKNSFRPIDKLNISTSLNYMQSRSQNNGISLVDLAPAGMNHTYVYARLADDNGSPLPMVKNNRFGYTEKALEMGLLDWHYRPLEELGLNDNTSGSQEVRLNTSVDYRLLRGLRTEARYQYQRIGGSARQHYSSDSYFARHEINRFTQADGSKPIPLGGILDRGSSRFDSHYGRFQLDYSGVLSGKHELNGLAGFELRQERNIHDGWSRLYGYNDDVLTQAINLDFDSGFPIRPRGGSGRINYGNSPGSQTVDRFVSYYANLAYTFNSKYTLSASTRWDASNIFGVAFNQKGVPLWSVGGAWNMANEQFFNVNWVSLAKLRATYGANGNAVRSVSSLPYIRFGTINSITGLPVGVLVSVGNPDLSWEQVNTANLGLDFVLFAGRLSGSVEWYNKSGKNLIGNDLFDPTTGIHVTSVGSYNLSNQRNYADLNTKGWDIELNTVNIDNGLKWQTTLLFSQVRNKVIKHHTPLTPPITNFFGAGIGVPVVEGFSRDQLYAIPWHGLDNTGAPLVMVDNELGTDYNGYFNGLTQEDLLKAGVSIPPYFGSIRNTFTWRSFSAGVNILWKAGHLFRQGSIEYNSLFGSSRTTHIDYLDRWQRPGDELTTNIPSMPQSANVRRDQAYLFSEALLEKGDHIRLQDINLSYQLPQKYSRSVGLSHVRLYGYANNLGILWKHTKYDIDPDARALYPRPIQVAFGLQIQL